MGWRIGVDIGGTFTDVVAVEPASHRRVDRKVLTTPADPIEGVLAGIRGLAEDGVELAAAEAVVHATTLITNALIERKGAPTALITNAGFADLPDIGDEGRYDLYDLALRKPEPLVPRARRFEVSGRLAADGAEIEPVNPAEVAGLDLSGVEAVAVCLLHAYATGAHEQAVRDALPDGIDVSLSSEVAPEIREYPRMTTAAANAYVLPIARRYLTRMRDALSAEGLTAPLYIALSHEGITTPEDAARFPIRILESGPAAGATEAARAMPGTDRILSFDIGGTTAKACYLMDGRPLIEPQFEAARVHRHQAGSGLPLLVPVVDLIEIGAGGGSIARRDPLGLIQAGPDSAGADPGPVCYGRGGTEPTVTDADLVLGHLDPEAFAAGTMALDVDGARAALGRLAGDPAEAARAVRQAIDEDMVEATRIHAVEKGLDPADFAMVAFGGAGPVHAAAVARRLGVSTVLLPVGAGVASAHGCLAQAPAFERTRSWPGGLDDLDLAQVDALLAELEADCRGRLDHAGAREVTVERWATLRYAGQGTEVPARLADGPLDAGDVRARFEAAYAELFGRTAPGN
ncbi:MAG TPA: hydantoinase/oxoprolinase family protein, partial [Gammaproteobacteria bacterium]|nr:hydantoinase/oxoprolinase family protein [Gammaproteobacteria bacterium]